MIQKITKLLFVSLLSWQYGQAQLITATPITPSLTEEVLIVFDATQGNADLANCNCDVYVHTGLITAESQGPSDWKHVVTQWGVADDRWKMTPIAGQANKYSFLITPSIREYYSVLDGEEVLQLAFVFRNATGTVAGRASGNQDILYTLNPFQTSEQDSLELVRFYEATDGPNWRNTWDLEQPVSTWFGVDLNSTGLVQELLLSNNLLFGNLIDLNLPALTVLNLSTNNLTGSVPDFLNSPKLIILNLEMNNLSGTIPDFSNVPLLINLALADNNLTGPIPDFSNLPALGAMVLYGNNLEGTLPDFNLPQLHWLNLNENPIVGNIPDFSNLPTLTTFECIRCRLNGTIPEFSNLPNLENLKLQENDLSGELPVFSSTPKLRNLFLEDNNLSGSIPDFPNLPNLFDLSLSGNNLEGEIPNFANLPGLVVLRLAANKLSGTIPDFTNLPTLELLLVDQNKLIGPLPNFAHIPRLINFNANFNNIADTIPDFSNLLNLERLLLAFNEFTFAGAFTNLPFLEYLEINDNQLTFDDVEPILGMTNIFGELVEIRYNNQAPVPAVCDTIWAATGSNLAFRLYFDEELTDNKYEWFRFGLPYLTTQGQNRLNIYDLKPEDTGEYSWVVTNPNVPDLMLTVDPVFLQVDDINQDSLNHVRLAIPDVFGSLGDTICFDIQAEPFDSLSSLDLSMKWDTASLRFNRIDQLNLPDLEAANFDLSPALVDKGRLTLSWESITNLGTGGESIDQTTRLYQVCFEARIDTCKNSFLEFTNDPLPLQLTNALDSCVFFDGRPGTFISTCNEEFTIPDESAYLAQREYTDTLGWTNYIKEKDLANLADTLLLSIQKNNREIGNVNDGRFEIEVQKKPNTIDITNQIRGVPGFEQIDQALALDYWWFVQPNYTFVEEDPAFGLSFYFEQSDIDRLSEAAGRTIDFDDIYFFKVSGVEDENPCLDFSSFEASRTQVFKKAATGSVSTWSLGGLGESSLVGSMCIIGFSCGGLMVINQTLDSEEVLPLKDLSVSPNPSRGSVLLNLKTPHSSKLELTIVDAMGQRVYSERLGFVTGDYQKQLALSHLSNGMYFLQISNEIGEQVFKKISIAK